MSELPAPLTPPECDLRGMEWMPLHGHKLYGSDFDAIASDAEYRAAQRLWWAAWQQQTPAASLPDDDRVLSHIAGYSRDAKGWAKIKAVAMHAFVKCSDGRLYHRFLAPEAVVAWDKRVKERERKAQYRAKKDGTPTPQPRNVPRDKSGTTAGPVAETVGDVRADRTTQDRTGQFKKEEVALGTDGDRGDPIELPASDPFPRYANPPGNPPMPCRNDPPEAWLHLGTPEPDDRSGNVLRPVVGGHYLDIAAELVCEAAKIREERWRGDWQPLIGWLRDGIDPVASIVPAIRRCAERPNYRPPATLKYFDRMVRDEHAGRVP